MKIEVNRKELIQVLKRLSAVVPKQTTLPILHSALIKADKKGIALHATDLDIWISDRIDGEINQVGTALFPVKKLEKAAKAFSGDTLSITITGAGEEEDHKLLLQCGKIKFEMDTRAVEDYPKLPDFKSKCDFRINSDLLNSMIEKIVYVVSTDLTRPALTGALLRVKKNKLTLIATDGHRLVKVEASSMRLVKLPKPTEIIIPPKALRVIKSYAEKDTSVYVHIGKQMVAFSNEQMQIMSRLCEGPFPNYKNVIPQNTKWTCTISREDFLESIKRISVFSDPLTRALLLEVEETKMTLSAHSSDTGTASEDIKCTGNGSFKVGYNATYLEQALKTLEGEEVKLSMEDDSRAGLIEEKTEDLDHMIILMPIRI